MENAEISAIDRLKMAMAARRCSIRKLSENTGIPYRTLQNYLSEKNKRNTMPMDALGAVCRALGVSADWILSGDLYLPTALFKAALQYLGLKLADCSDYVSATSLINTLAMIYDAEMNVPLSDRVRRALDFATGMPSIGGTDEDESGKN